MRANDLAVAKKREENGSCLCQMTTNLESETLVITHTHSQTMSNSYYYLHCGNFDSAGFFFGNRPTCCTISIHCNQSFNHFIVLIESFYLIY